MSQPLANVKNTVYPLLRSVSKSLQRSYKMEFFFQESISKKNWNLFMKRQDGAMVWIANRPTLAELRKLVA